MNPFVLLNSLKPLQYFFSYTPWQLPLRSPPKTVNIWLIKLMKKVFLCCSDVFQKMCMVKSSFDKVTGQKSGTLLRKGSNAVLVFNRKYLLECATHWSSKGQLLRTFREKVRRKWSLKKSDRLKGRKITVNDIRRGNINITVIIVMVILITKIKIKIAKMIIANVNSVSLCNDS